jgi:Salmonella virulence plasmid 65kDa B protein/Insecticide toxin TcdB middle/N-terminal region/FG-GAP-like repeat
MPAKQRGRVIGASSVLHVLGQGALSLTVGLALSLFSWASAAQVSVSSGGSPNYSQPIAVPPGISGMQPNLALFYAGGGINGPVGHGWSVQGLSMITRCPATRYTDAATRGVKFDQSDKLCLDGQRLIQTDANGVVTPAAVFDANGKLTSFPQINDALGLASGWREYRTEKDSFARIRAYGVANGSDVNGPAYFRVWTKAGQIYEYGTSANVPAAANAAITAQGKNVVMVWAVGRVSDVVGNYIDFKYELRDVAWGSGPASSGPTLGREWNIAEIQYTGNTAAAQLPTNKVIFRYSDRTLDRGEAYQRGSKNVSVRRLDLVETYVNSPSNAYAVGVGNLLVKRTRLTYDNAGALKRSRLMSIKECADAAEAKCLPATSFVYANGGSDSFDPHPVFAASTLSTTLLRTNSGTVGVEVADFNGDGLSDLLKWSQTPTDNRLYLSNGDGTFAEVPVGTGAGQFNVRDLVLFSDGGCAASLIMDFNWDGLPDIFRYNAYGTGGCGSTPPYLYINKGDGSFERRNVTGVSLLKRPQGATCTGSDPVVCTYSQGDTFYVLDVDGDGTPDIVKALIPADGAPGSGDQCASAVCTQVYKGDGQGNFSEITAPLGVKNKILYMWPSGESGSRALAQQRYVADVDGDGLDDIVFGATSYSARRAWRSLGNGDFEEYTAPTDAEDCTHRGDFNGDGRSECLWPSSDVTSSKLTVSTGTQLQKVAFNLAVVGGPGLKGGDKGVRVLDFNGDGRTDILRWHDDGTQVSVYLADGNGSFTISPTFNLTNNNKRLVTSGGSFDFVTGDFTGRGLLEILRLHGSPSAGEGSSNQLYVKNNPTIPDQLLSVTSPTGLRTLLTYDSLSNKASGRYVSDRSDNTNKAAYPLIDLTIASPVVVTTTTDVGVGTSTLQTQYAYKGLKAAVDGRGMLGFRQTVQSGKAPNGDDLSVWTDYLLDEPYAGVARRSQTLRGAWTAPTAQLLSTTSNTYCDRTSATSPDAAAEAAPCATNARVRRPYLRKSIESGFDLNGTALPTVTTINTYNDYGDPTDIVVSTTGTMAGLATPQTFTKTTANTFCAPDITSCPNTATGASPNKISGDNWILGRITRSTVSNTVPNLLTALMPATSPGDAPNAAAVVGSLTASGLTLSGCTNNSPATAPSAATMSCTLINTGGASAASISYTTAASTTVSGPTGACAAGATCGVVTVTTSTAVGTYSGTLTATPNAGTAATQPINLTVKSAATLSFSGCTSTTPTVTPTKASMTCTLSNAGQTAANSISYTTAPNTTVAGPTASCAAGAACGTVTVTTATAAATYSGTLTAIPNSGIAATQPISLVVAPPPQASFSPVSGTALSASSSQQCKEARVYRNATVSVTNVGGGSLSILGSSSTWALGFTYSCTTASAGQTCIVGIRRVGSGSGTVTITTNGGVASYPVSGAYGPPPAANCQPLFAPPPTE